VAVARASRQPAGWPSQPVMAAPRPAVLPVLGLRRRIAIQMQEAKRRIPHFSYVEEVDVTDLEATRSALNAQWGTERGRLTPLPLLMRAIVLAAAAHPRLNAWFDDEAGQITQHGGVHIGVATDTRHGLLVPVVRHAEDAACGPWPPKCPPGRSRACRPRHTRRTERVHHHHQQPGRLGRHRLAHR
jgi:2-oxoisovalerate dehydrogenase E2 component (dihydrolipoyl transacylase)